jgi:hypothetical protein
VFGERAWSVHAQRTLARADVAMTAATHVAHLARDVGLDDDTRSSVRQTTDCFVAENQWVGSRAASLGECHIAAAYARQLDVDEDLSGPAPRLRHLSDDDRMRCLQYRGAHLSD